MLFNHLGIDTACKLCYTLSRFCIDNDPQAVHPGRERNRFLLHIQNIQN